MSVCRRVVVAVIGAAAVGQCMAQPGSVLSSPGQRYVFGQVSEYARHQYLLDTQTGRLWQLVCAKSGEKTATGEKAPCVLSGLDPIPFLGTDGEPVAYQPATKQ